MKKNRKFFTFSIINIKNLISFLSTLFIAAYSIYALGFFTVTRIDGELVNFIVRIGAELPYSPPKGNIVKTMLNVSVPYISFASPVPAVKTEPSAPSEVSTESASLPPENDAQSITYKSAEEKGYKSLYGIYINNQTGKSVDIQALLNKELDISLSDAPSVLILHTHTTESYTPSLLYNYSPSETDRTTDENFNMVSVGTVIYDSLTKNGINVIHDKTVNDYPSYSTSYSNSLKLMESYTKSYPSIKIIIDVHRDAMVTSSGVKIRPMASFDPPCAQVMMVVGTNDSGLSHPNWQTNLSFVLKLQEKMNTLYPSLARPINLRRQRFNQHTAPYAFILEVGTNGNTLDEAKEAARLFSESLISLLQN